MATEGVAVTGVMAPVEYRCLVIGPIGDALAPVGSPENDSYVRGMQVLGALIEPACARFGIRPVRADRMRRRGDIPTQVYEAIRDWDLVIADLTGENPNVMYELALRHFTGKCSISIAEWGRLPFDVSHIRTDKYVHTDVGLVAGRSLLEAAIETILSDGGCDDLPVTLIFRGAPYPSEPPVMTVSGSLSADAVLVQADGTTTLSQPPLPDSESTGPEDEYADLGFLDLLVESEDAMPRLVEHLKAVTEIVEEIGEVFERATKEANTAAVSETATARDRLIIVIRVGQQLDPAAERLERTAEAYSTDMARVDRGISYILDRIAEDPSKQAEVAEFLDAIRALRTHARSGMESTSNLASSVASLANISKVLRGPVSRVVLGLRHLNDTSAIIEDWGQRLDVLPDVDVPSHS